MITNINDFLNERKKQSKVNEDLTPIQDAPQDAPENTQDNKDCLESLFILFDRISLLVDEGYINTELAYNAEKQATFEAVNTFLEEEGKGGYESEAEFLADVDKIKKIIEFYKSQVVNEGIGSFISNF